MRENLADRLQDKLTGRAPQRERLTLKLADNSQDVNSLEKRDPVKLNPHRKGEDADAHFEHEKNGNDSSTMPNNAIPKEPQNESVSGGGNDETSTPEQRQNPTDSSTDKSADAVSSDSSSNGGSAHGIGADPDTLFGSPSDPKMGGQGFEISIDARSEIKGPQAVRARISSAQGPHSTQLHSASRRTHRARRGTRGRSRRDKEGF